MHPSPHRLFTEEEYLTIERAAEYKSEYLDGGIYAMAGAGRQHSRTVASILASIHNQFRGRPYDVFASDMRVRVSEGGLYTYSDIVALCGASHMLDQHGDTLLNPQLVVEVLSPSTASYDLGEKGDRYRRLKSLTDYVLVSQEQIWVRHWVRQMGQSWIVTDYEQPSDRLRIEALAVELSFSDIYERITFPTRVMAPPR